MKKLNRRGLVLLALCALTLALTATAAQAETLAPWWGVTTGTRPTNLSGANGKDETQRVTVNATGGDYLLVRTDTFKALVVPYNTTAAALRGQIEGFYPERKVQVTEEASAEENTRVWVITFPSQAIAPFLGLADTAELAANFGGAPLTGGKAEASDTELQAGQASENQVVITAQDRGDAPTAGLATLTSHLPPGLEAVRIESIAGGLVNAVARGPVACTLATLTCTYGEYERENEKKEKEVIQESLKPYEQIELRIAVVPKAGAHSGEQISATVSGASAASPVAATREITLGGPLQYGYEDFALIPENPGGTLDTQAGSHPFQLTNVITLNTQTPDSLGYPRAVALPKDIVAELPTGLVGNPTPFKQCTDAQFANQRVGTIDEAIINECPADAAVGVATLTFNEPSAQHLETATAPIFNMTPRPGEPARFAFKALGIVPAFLDASVRTGADYGVTITSSNITQLAGLLGVKLAFWGVPGDPRHDTQRGWECLEGGSNCQPSTTTTPPPFLDLPTSCQAPYRAVVSGDSWGSSAHPAEQAPSLPYTLPESLDGCNRLPFEPSISVSPDVSNSSTATGLAVHVHVDQKAALNAEGLAESSLRDTTLTLPEGVTLNPAGADGLEACSITPEPASATEPARPGGQIELKSAAPVRCPNASKVATAKILTPLLANPLEGAVYLATPAPNGEAGKNPFNSLIAMYIVVRDPVSGTVVKLAGEVQPDPVTGQLVSRFKDTPELPFEDLELHFFGGARAPLATPPHCGSFTSTATFTPWSGAENASPFAAFNIEQGPNGTPCPGGVLPFAPLLAAGTTNINAGAFTPLTTTISREDGNQNIASVQLHMPPGLSGVLSGVKLCPEAQANAGTCGPESLIGHTVVSVGLGASPFTVTGGEVFLTEKYQGAPFGLSIVNPAKAGPFDLGKVIVRARVEVDLHTAALTITTGEIPHIIKGIPLQIKHVNVLIDRPGFTFNPTNCSPMSVTGTVGSAEGATAPVSIPFQVTNCAVLKFAPKFQASTAGKTSKATGASLNVKLTYPKAPFGSQANIASVKVDLPKQLPSQLKTLQKACTAAQFEANPANCPAASIVGHASATTPLLPVPLIGPAYFVSHGGEAFPSLIVVLQGYGVRLDLVGSTFISKAGITSSTFKTVPDAPVGSFELNLPQGKYSALAANGNLCKSKLAMPTEFLAQNGAKINQSTKITVTGCVKAKKARKHRGSAKSRRHVASRRKR